MKDKNDLLNVGNFALVVKENDNRQQILFAANNRVMLERFVDEINGLNTFLKQIENFIGLKDIKKIVKMLLIINKYYGGEQCFFKNENFELDLCCENSSSFKASYTDLQKLVADLVAIKNKIKKEKLTIILSELIDTLN